MRTNLAGARSRLADARDDGVGTGGDAARSALERAVDGLLRAVDDPGVALETVEAPDLPALLADAGGRSS
jgi:hypothetical protein